MRIARFSGAAGLRVFYFISPKVWAWRQGRVKKLKKYTEKLFVILPFEIEFFRQFGMEVEYHGNPLVDGIVQFRREFDGPDNWRKSHAMDRRPLVALLAGSRKKEIEATLPRMIDLAKAYPGYQFVVAGAPSIDPSFYQHFLNNTPVRIVYEETYPLLASSDAGLVTSGTATLEAALIGVPQAVVYKTGWLAYSIAKLVVKVKFISLVNLIMGSGVVKEIIQKDLYPGMKAELDKIMGDHTYIQSMKEQYGKIRNKLGEAGVAERIGRRMVAMLKPEEG
jgi:lipid-A-disaccharide synthase